MNMNCDKALETMQTVLDRADRATGLAPVSDLPLREHLAACTRCRRLWDELSAVESGLASLARRDDASPSPGLHRRIMAALQHETQRRETRRPLSGWRALAAAAGLLIGLGLISWIAVHSHHPSGADQPNLALPSLTLDVAAIDPAVIYGAAARDFKELAMSILATTDGVTNMIPKPPQQTTPSPRPTEEKNL